MAGGTALYTPGNHCAKLMRYLQGKQVRQTQGLAITVEQVATVTEGGAVRQGAITQDGQGEQVYAIPMLLMGENGRVVVQRVEAKMGEVQKSLPAGAKLVGHMDRSQLIDRTIHTAASNLVEGGVLVIGVLFLFLLNFRTTFITLTARVLRYASSASGPPSEP